MRLFFSKFAGCLLILEDIDQAHQLPASPNDQTVCSASLAVASEWLSTCKAEHGLCVDTIRATRYLPTRLLEILAMPSSSALYFRLCVSSSLAADTEYVTLSHCWGQGAVLQLKTASLFQLQEQPVCVTEVSATFKQAIEVSWHLGFRYLWIDSLCIIQDSLEDWHNEASKMMDVYSNSQCTLAATASADGCEGLSRPRDVRCIQPYIKIPASDGFLVYGCVNTNAFKREILHSPLNSRAWVLQERLLSPRILHFSDLQVWWTCNETILSESYASHTDVVQHASSELRHSTNKGSGDMFVYDTSRRPPDMLLEVNGISDNFRWMEVMNPSSTNRPGHGGFSRWLGPDQEFLAPSTSLFEVWDEFVFRYTRTSLTYTADKAIAIGGVARAIQRRLGKSDRYLAGIWKNNWKTQIMWSCHNSSESVKSNRVPSWSWVSVDGAINMQSLSEHQNITMATLVETDIVPVTEDPFGPLKSAVIRISGFLHRVDIRITDEWDTECQINGEVCHAHVFLDEEPEENGPVSADLCFLILTREPAVPWCNGLLLRPYGDFSGHFQRIGCIYAAQVKDIELSNMTPFITTDLELKNEGERDGGRHMVSIA